MEIKQNLFRAAAWISRYELWITLAVVPALLFPGSLLTFMSAGLAATIWICRRITTGKFTRRTAIDLPVVILVLTLMLGLWISIAPEMSQARVWNYLLGIILFYAVVNAARPSDHWRAIFIITALMTVGLVLFSLVATDWSNVRLVDIPWIYDHLPGLIRSLPGSGVPHNSDLINARWIGITLGFLIPFLVPFLFSDHQRKFKLLFLAAILLAFFDLLLTQSLQGLAGLAAGLVFIALWKTRKAGWVILAVVGIGLALFLAAGPQRLTGYLLSIDNPLGIAVALRLDMWSRAAAMIHDFPFTGIGVNIFSVIQSNFYPGYIIGLEPHAHNLYLQTALDQGLPGLCAMLAMFLAWGITVRKNYRDTSQPGYRLLLLGTAAAVISFLVAGLMDGMTLGAKPAPVIWAFLGIGAAPAVIQPLQIKAATPQRSRLGRFIAPLILCALVFAGIFLFFPAALAGNYGSLLAHQALYPGADSQSFDSKKAQEALYFIRKGIDNQTGSSHLHLLAGRLEGLLGDNPAAVDHLSQSVQLDLRDPFQIFNPAGYLLQSLQAARLQSNNPGDLMMIYHNWLARYPSQAEYYILFAIVLDRHKQDPVGARSILQRGIKANATPEGLLDYYLGQIK